MNIESIKDLLDGFDAAALLPDPGILLDKLDLILRILVLAGPIVMVVMGLLYLFAAPKEANHHFGYRCYFGMGSVDAWRYTQRVAGTIFIILGVILGIVMLVVSGGFAEKNTMDMLLSAVVCVLWEAGLILLATFVIRTIMAARFDRHGEKRKKKAST